jgi:transcription elongation GreA/GreB family factor
MGKILPKIKNETPCNDKVLEIDFGDLVKIKIDNDIEKEVKIVKSSNIDPENGIISYTSPLGLALIGKKIGEKVEFEIGDKKREVQILDITKE